MEELTIGEKKYVSSKRAAEISGYAKDYIGQLCREGRVEARLVGRNWYVLESALQGHRFGQDTQEPAPEAPQEAPEARYEAEEVIPLPIFDSAPQETAEQEGPQVTDMQEAWKDWFANRKEQDVPLQAEEKAQEEGKEEDPPQAVPLEIKHGETPLDLKQYAEDLSIEQERLDTEADAHAPVSPVLLRAALVFIAIISIATTLVSLGFGPNVNKISILSSVAASLKGEESIVNK